MKPLEGMRILTIEQFGAGPYGSLFLSDLGAEVIKIENAETKGDTARHVGPRFLGENDSEYFQTFSSNKKSVTLDLKSEVGLAAFRRLVSAADAVMNNLRGDQPEKLGLDYESLRAVNQAVVCLHISAYGRDNDRKAWPGYDFLMQAEAGLMSLTGEPDAPPTRFGLSMVDFMTGAQMALVCVAAIMKARECGVGCDVGVGEGLQRHLIVVAGVGEAHAPVGLGGDEHHRLSRAFSPDESFIDLNGLAERLTPGPNQRGPELVQPRPRRLVGA